MEAVGVAFVAIFLAELGDKSQLIALGLASRHRALPVLAGIAVAIAVLQALAVGVGSGLSRALPERAIEVVAGLVFLAVAAWTVLRHDDDEDGAIAGDAKVARLGRSIALTAGTAFFVAELGDKTQLATLALASSNGAWPTWVGATLGELTADTVAVVVGARLGARVPDRIIARVSAVLFAAVGVLLVTGLAP